MVTSVRDSDRVFRWDPDVFREGFGRLEEDMLCDAVGQAAQSYKVLGWPVHAGHRLMGALLRSST